MMEKILGIELVGLVRELIEIQRLSYENASRELKDYTGESSGLSSRSIRRFCARHGICMISRMDENALDRLVRGNVSRVS